MAKAFTDVGTANFGRSIFDLSYEKKFTCDMGQLIPVMCDECVPGDIMQISAELVIRMQPLVAPILHEINAYIHYFFVPYRLLWDEWESFITGGIDGTEAPTLPRWGSAAMTEGNLGDYLGWPTGVITTGVEPMIFPATAYVEIYNNYYRDETLVSEKPVTGTILNRAWEKDYFTSALPWQQRGVAPALPISGTTSAVFPNYSAANQVNMSSNSVTHVASDSNTWQTLNLNTVDMSSAATFDVADLRLAFQVQRWLERNARAGVRYTEFLKSHFNVSPRDDRLDRPEYLGGMKTPVIVSEVLQTSSTDATSAQGNLAGHGITVDRSFIAKYRVEEFGLIMGILSVMPRSAYQQGIDRQWLRETKYDFYFPEFANLSEQGVKNAELYVTDNDTVTNNAIFGYQGRYDEMRVKKNLVCSGMKSTFDYWHLGRQFTSLPTLSESFIECDPAETKRIFAVPSEDGLIVNVGNKIKAVRPLPIIANPGLIDHV